MFSWLKRLFGKKLEPVVLTNPVNREELKITDTAPAKPKTEKPKKAATKKPKAETIDFDSLSKAQLLDLAKSLGVKANASLKKDELVARLKDAS